MRRIAVAARSRSIVGLAFCIAAFAAAGCGGDDSESMSTLPGSSNLDPGAPEFGKNVVRIPGQTPVDVAAGALLAAYPPEQGRVPNGFIMFPPEDWHRAVLSAQFVSAPVNGALLPSEMEYLSAAPADLVKRLRPPGFPVGPKLQALIMGEPGAEVVLAFQDEQETLTKLAESDPAKLASELVAYRGGWSEKFTDDILIVSSEDEDRPYSLIAASWSGLTGDTVGFVEGDTVPEATVAMLQQRRQLRLIKPTIWIVGPESAVSEEAASELGQYGEVKRVEGEGPIETAVEMARYRDQKTGFGWGLTKGPVNVSLVNIEDWGNAIGALQLTGAGPRAPLLFTDSREELPEPVVEYLREIQGAEPSQGYVLGDRNTISPPLLAEFDELLGVKPGTKPAKPAEPEGKGGAAGAKPKAKQPSE